MRAAMLVTILMACLFASANAAGDLHVRVAMLEDTYDRYFSLRACPQGETPYDLAWADFELWRTEEQTRRMAEQDSLSGLYKPVETFSLEIDALEKLEAEYRDRGEEAHGDSLRAVERRRFGRLAARTEQLVAYNRVLAEHYRGQQIYIDERSAKLAELDEMVRDVERYNQWVETEGPKIFALDLAHLLVDVRKELRKSGAAQEQQDLLNRVRNLRRRLATHTAERNRQEGVALMLVEVLVGDEPCYLYIDSGAEKVMLSPLLVEALDWETRLGEYVAVMNVDGRTSDGQRLYIPAMSYREHEALDVEATILEWTRIGTDGLLGMSYLDLFEVTIDESADPPLSLQPKP